MPPPVRQRNRIRRPVLPATLVLLLSLLALFALASMHLLVADESADIRQNSTVPPVTLTTLPVPDPLPPPEEPAPTATATPTESWQVGSVFISELLPRPAASSAQAGEWIELHNAGDTPVDLRGWVLSQPGVTERIETTLIIAAHGYVVLARELNPWLNGGVQAQMIYSRISLDNTNALALQLPDGATADQAEWGAVGNAHEGRSLERADFNTPDAWRLAWRAWPGSAGDWGSPGAPNTPPPEQTATITRTPTRTKTPRASTTPTRTPTASRTPAATPTATPTLVPLPEAWQWRSEGSPLWLDEVSYRGDDTEFIVLVNRTTATVSLEGWLLGDATWPGAREGMVALSAVELPAGARFVVARNGESFVAHWGRLPDAQIDASTAPVPRLVADRRLGTGQFSLSDRGDTLLLLDPNHAIADAISFGGAGDGDDAIQLHARMNVPSGHALHRMPNATSPHQSDQRYGWMIAPPSPFASVSLPAPAPERSSPALADGYFAWWGALGTQSIFARDGSAGAPPQYILHSAAAQGLDFLALGDLQHHPLLSVPPRLTLLPAWRWQDGDGNGALLLDDLYGDFSGGITDIWAMLSWLNRRHPVAMWLTGDLPHVPELSMAQLRAAPIEELRTKALALWRKRGAPILPVVLTESLSTDAAVQWRTGLVSKESRPNGLLDAMHRARGWLTTNASLHLALSAETATGRVWMGDSVEPTNSLRLRIDAADGSGNPVTVRLWQDETLLYTGPVNQIGYVDVLAPPNAWFYLTVEETGTSALSAPLLVAPPRQETVIMTEVLADPKSDWNGDGSIDDGDEFVEFFNTGTQPVSLAGWVLQDKVEAYDGRGQFRFSAKHVIPAGGYLVLWRDGGGPVINANDEAIFLRSPGFGMADEVGWGETMPPDRSVARVDGQWFWNTSPSPGRAAIFADGMTLHIPSVDPEPDVYISAATEFHSGNSMQPVYNTPKVASTELLVWTGAVNTVRGSTLWLADLLHPGGSTVRVQMPVDRLGHPPAALPGEVWRVYGSVGGGSGEVVVVAERMERIVIR